MKSRIRKFYDDVCQILDEIGENQENFLNAGADKDPSSSQLPLPHTPQTDGDQLEKRKRDLILAIKIDDVEQLESAIDGACVDGYYHALQHEIAQAEHSLKNKINLERIRRTARDVPQSVISELRSYAKPTKAVHDVMLCLYLILGAAKEENLKTWISIQALMSQTGKNGLKRSMERRRACDIEQELIKRVKQLLASYDFQYIYDVSEGAAVFFVWITEMVAEVEAETKND